MAGFGDLPVAGAGGNAAGQAVAAPQQPHNSFLGGLYNAIFRPAVNTVAGGLSDIPKIASSVGFLGKEAAAGITRNDTAAKNAADNQAKLLAGSNFRKNYEDPNLEKALGKTTSNVASVLAFTPAGGAIKGASVGSKLLKAGGLGAAFGGVQGAANEMGQGAGLDQVGQGALAGAATGAATGAALHGAGMAGKNILGRLTGGADAAAGAGKGPIGKAAYKMGQDKAAKIQATNAAEFGPGTHTAQGVNSAVARDKQGLPVGFPQVTDFLRGLGMTPDLNGGKLSDNMQILHDVGNQTISYHMAKATNDIKVDGSSAADIGRTAVLRNRGSIGGGKNGAAADTLAQVRIATEGLGRNSSVADIVGAISNLERYQKDLAPGVAAGDAKSVGQNNVYKAVADHLHEALDNKDVSKAVAEYKMTDSDANAIRADTQSAGGTPELATHLIKTIDDAKTYGALRSAKQIPVVAGELADTARMGEAKTIPGAPAEGTTSGPSVASEAGVAVGVPHLAPLAISRMQPVRAAGRALGGTVLRTLAPGAYKGGLAEGLAPAPETMGKINLGNESAGMPGSAPAPGMAAGGTPPPPPPGAGGPAAMLGQLAGNIGAGAGSVLPGGVRNTLAGQAGIGASDLQTGSGQPPVDQQQAGGGLDQLSGQIDQMTQNAGADTSQQQPSDYPLSAMESDIARDPKNASTYETLYKDLQSAEAPPKASAAQQTSAANIADGLSYIQSAIQESQGMGGTGLQHSGANIPIIGQRLDSKAAAYNKTAIDLATAFAKAMTGRAAVPKSLIDSYMNSVPRATDSPQQAQDKLNNLYIQLKNKADSEAGTNPAMAQLIGGQ